MESDLNPFPKFDILPGSNVIRKIGHLGLSLVHLFIDRHSTHHQNTGGGPALDRALYDVPTEEIPIVIE